jgi:hypothetical protein
MYLPYETKLTTKSIQVEEERDEVPDDVRDALKIVEEWALKNAEK